MVKCPHFYDVYISVSFSFGPTYFFLQFLLHFWNRTACSNQFWPSVMWVPGIKLRSPGLAVVLSQITGQKLPCVYHCHTGVHDFFQSTLKNSAKVTANIIECLSLVRGYSWTTPKPYKNTKEIEIKTIVPVLQKYIYILVRCVF